MSANPDLPILDELGAEFAAMVDADFAASPGRRHGERPHQRARLPQVAPRPRRGAHRVARRVAILLVLLCLIGGVALAAHFGAGAGQKDAHTAPTVIGQDTGGRWRLSAYRDRGRICLLFSAGGELTERCGQPGLSRLQVTSAIADGHRYVVGLAPPRVRAVAVQVAGASATAATGPVADPDAADGAGVPRAARWFVVPIDPGAAQLQAPAAVVALDGRGHRLGPAYADCSLGGIDAACQRRIRARAGRASR